MAYTKFAEFIRVLRVKNHETMADTAKLLEVTVPFVSAVENGKRNVPEEWIPILTEHYNLTLKERNELKQAIVQSKTQSKINLTAAPSFRRELALQFQRSFENIEEETAKQIMQLLERDDK